MKTHDKIIYGSYAFEERSIKDEETGFWKHLVGDTEIRVSLTFSNMLDFEATWVDSIYSVIYQRATYRVPGMHFEEQTIEVIEYEH